MTDVLAECTPRSTIYIRLSKAFYIIFSDSEKAVGIFRLLIYAGMMELVDMRDLGSRAAMCWGSSPHARTSSEKALRR